MQNKVKNFFFIITFQNNQNIHSYIHEPLDNNII